MSGTELSIDMAKGNLGRGEVAPGMPDHAFGCTRPYSRGTGEPQSSLGECKGKDRTILEFQGQIHSAKTWELSQGSHRQEAPLHPYLHSYLLIHHEVTFL